MIPLTPSQHAELVRYQDGEPHRFEARPSANLIRRDLLRLESSAGEGFYTLTALGAAALEERAYEVLPGQSNDPEGNCADFYRTVKGGTR